MAATDDYRFIIAAQGNVVPGGQVVFAISMADETPSDNPEATSFDLDVITYSDGATGLTFNSVALGSFTNGTGGDPVNTAADGWSIFADDAGGVSPLDIAISKQSGGAGYNGAGTVQIALITFDVGADVSASLTVSISLSNSFVNGSLTSAILNEDGTASLGTALYQGDVSGDGDVTARDASLTLQSCTDRGHR